MTLPSIEEVAAYSALALAAFAGFRSLALKIKELVLELRGPDDEPTMRELAKATNAAVADTQERVGIIESRLDSQDQRLVALELRREAE